MPLNVTVLSTVSTTGVEFRAASAPGFTDGEIAASARITRAPNAGARMPGFPGLTGGLEERTFSGALALDHSLPPEGRAERRNAEWLTAPLPGQPAILYSQTLADTIADISGAPDLSDPSWNQIPLRIIGLKQDGEEILIEWEPASADELDVDINVAVFSGGGNGVAILAALADSLNWANGNNGGALEPSLTSDWYYEISGVILDTGDLTAANQTNIIWSGGSDGIVLRINISSNANIRAQVFQGAVVTNATSATGILSESRRPVAIGFGRDTSLDVIYATLNGDRVASAAFTGTIDNNAVTDLIVGASSTLSAVAEFRIWDITPSAEILKSFANKPMDPINPPSGLVEFFRVGTGSGNQAKWIAVIDTPGNDSTGVGGSPDTNYGGQGQPEHDGFTFPTTAGQVFGLLPQVVDPADIVFGLHFETVSLVKAFFRADEFFDISVNSPFTGDVTVNTKPQADFGLSEVRFDFTGDPVADYEALIKYFLLTDDVGPVAPADLASPFVVGPVLDQPAGFHVKPALTGVASSKAGGIEGERALNPTVAKTQAELCRGAGVVLTKNSAAEWELIRVPPEPFALTDPHFELREVGGDEGDFSAEGITVSGAVVLNVQDEQTVAFKRFIDPLKNPTLGASAAEPLDISRSALPFLSAKFLRDQVFRDEFPGSEPGTVVPAHFTIRDDAFKEASRRGFSLLSLPNLRKFKITLSRVPEAGILQLGARVVIFTTQHKPTDGIPCFVTGYSSGGFTGATTTGGWIELMEMGRWRLAPDAYVDSADLSTPSIADIQQDAMLQDSATSDAFSGGGGSAGDGVRVSFPTPTSLKPAGRHLLRCQFAEVDGSTGFGHVEIFESGSIVRAMSVLEIQGQSQKFDADRIVTVGEFNTEELADVTGVDIECRFEVDKGPIGVIHAIDLIYEYDR